MRTISLLTLENEARLSSCFGVWNVAHSSDCTEREGGRHSWPERSMVASLVEKAIGFVEDSGGTERHALVVLCIQTPFSLRQGNR